MSRFLKISIPIFMLSGIIVFFLKFETNPKITLASTPPIINIEHVTDATGNVYNIPKTFTCGVNPLINQVSVNGSGSGTTPPGQIDQYQVQVDWGDGIQNNGIGVFTPSTGNGPFTFTFSAGIHTYGAPGAYTVKARIYHQGLPGNDSTADSVSTIQICFDVNDPPVISNVPASASIPELSAYTFTATSTDDDPAKDTVVPPTFSLVGAPAGASIDSSTGVFTWTPTEAQGPGVYAFNVRATDGVINTDAPISLTVTEVNSAPISLPSSVSTPLDTPKIITMGATDSDIPANTLTYSIVSGPTNGTLGTITGNQVTYTPTTSYFGSDSFTFRVNDGTTNSNTSTISINVLAGGSLAPILDGISDQIVDEGTLLSFSVSATNSPTYSYSSSPTVSAIDALNTSSFTWTPTEAEGPGVYVVTVTATNGSGSDSVTFSITVNEVNVAPTADDQSGSTNEDTPTLITLTGADTDLPAQALSFSVVTQPLHGTVFISGSSATYSPDSNYNGADSFTFKANDGVTDSLPATIDITVDPVNDPPTVTLIGNSTMTVRAGSIFTDPGATGDDVEDGALTPIVTGSVDTSTLGTYYLTYEVTDSGSLTASVVRTVIVDNRASGNSVIGKIATPSPVVPLACDIYLDKFMRLGYENDSDSVKKMQTFLNNYLHINLPINGDFDSSTESAVKVYQLLRKTTILLPWHISQPTGIVYVTTTTDVNNVICPDLHQQLPKKLVPFNQNPDAPKKIVR